MPPKYIRLEDGSEILVEDATGRILGESQAGTGSGGGAAAKGKRMLLMKCS